MWGGLRIVWVPNCRLQFASWMKEKTERGESCWERCVVVYERARAQDVRKEFREKGVRIILGNASVRIKSRGGDEFGTVTKTRERLSRRESDSFRLSAN